MEVRRTAKYLSSNDVSLEVDGAVDTPRDALVLCIELKPSQMQNPNGRAMELLPSKNRSGGLLAKPLQQKMHVRAEGYKFSKAGWGPDMNDG